VIQKIPVKRSSGGTISLKSSASKKVATGAGAKKSSGTINLFSSGTQKISATNPVKKSLGTINLSSAGTRKIAPKTPAKKTSGGGTFNLFGKPDQKVAKQAAAAPKDNIPVLKNWTQNSDRSISGAVSNAKNFRNNERITTSPIRGAAKKGSVVSTASGSKYRLM